MRPAANPSAIHLMKATRHPTKLPCLTHGMPHSIPNNPTHNHMRRCQTTNSSRRLLCWPILRNPMTWRHSLHTFSKVVRLARHSSSTRWDSHHWSYSPRKASQVVQFRKRFGKTDPELPDWTDTFYWQVSAESSHRLRHRIGFQHLLPVHARITVQEEVRNSRVLCAHDALARQPSTQQF